MILTFWFIQSWWEAIWSSWRL